MDTEGMGKNLEEGRLQLVQQLNNAVAEINRLTAIRDELIRKIDRQDGAIALLGELSEEEPEVPIEDT